MGGGQQLEEVMRMGFHEGISTLVRDPWCLPARKRSSPGTKSADALILESPAFRTMRINLCCWSCPIYSICLWESELRQRANQRHRWLLARASSKPRGAGQLCHSTQGEMQLLSRRLDYLLPPEHSLSDFFDWNFLS